MYVQTPGHYHLNEQSKCSPRTAWRTLTNAALVLEMRSSVREHESVYSFSGAKVDLGLSQSEMSVEMSASS